jgi:hypothetical protein
MMQQHAFVIEAGEEEGVTLAQEWAKRELGLHIENNPDVVVARYGLLSVEDARKVADMANGAPFVGETKVVIICASRAYHEAQNALLKLFEEPPAGTFLFLIMPSLGGLLPTLRSRVQVLSSNEGPRRSLIPEEAEAFLKASKEKRTAIIKKLTSGKDDEDKRANREEAIAILNGIEVALLRQGFEGHVSALSDIATLRMHLYDRSAPVKMILEHVSLVIPRDLR